MRYDEVNGEIHQQSFHRHRQCANAATANGGEMENLIRSRSQQVCGVTTYLMEWDIESFGPIRALGLTEGRVDIVCLAKIPSSAQASLLYEGLSKINKEAMPRLLSLLCCYPQREKEYIRQHEGAWAALPVACSAVDVDSGKTELTWKRTDNFSDRCARAELRLENIVCWRYYSDWLAAKVDQILAALPVAAAEEYQLQSYLERFSLETKSPFINTAHNSIRAVWQDHSEGGSRSENGLKELYGQVRGLLEEQIRCLVDVLDGIEAVYSGHPELIPLFRQARVVYQLLQWHVPKAAKQGSWGRDILLLQLANCELGVTACISSGAGGCRTTICAATALAMAQLYRRHPYDELFSLAVGWDDLQKNPPAHLAHPSIELLRECVLNNMILLR